MNIEVLINQLDEHNENSILATKKYKPKEVIYLYEKKDQSIMTALENYYKSNISNVIFKKIVLNEGHIENIKNIINENKNKNILVNLTGGKRINSLLLLNFSIENNIKTIYIDYKGQIIYLINKDSSSIREEFEDLKIENIFKAAGGEIINDSTNLIDNEDIKILTKIIYKNLDVWHKYKQKLYDQKIFFHDYKDSKRVIIHLKELDDQEKYLLYKILEKLKELKGISYFEKNKIIEVLFQNEYLKPFIFKSGTWLEVATNILIEEIEEIDEVKSGVIFLWNKEEKKVKNEVDIVLVKDSVITCISCKDSSKYNEDTLNELDIYSNQIGGKEANKILVSTKLPEKASIKQRAKEMDIHLIIFDGNEQKFKEEIKKIIRKTN